MIFSRVVKDELARIEPSKRCCRLAELSAIIHVDGTLHIQSGSYALHTVTENAATARMTIKLLSELFGLKAEVTARRSLLHKSNNYVVYISPQESLDQALNELGILDDSLRLRYGILPRIVNNRCCAIAYLRGSFMGGGSISDPRKEHHFELNTDNKELAKDIRDLLIRFNLPAKISTRKKNFAVYLSDSKSMSEFLALVGAYGSLLEWEEISVVKGMRSQVNRLVNCETANLNKTIEAALAQLRDIKLIEKEVGLEKLPEGLRQIAEARLEYPYVSIKELGSLCNPLLSKSAVYHRMRRLSVIAGGLRGRKNRLKRAAN